MILAHSTELHTLESQNFNEISLKWHFSVFVSYQGGKKYVSNGLFAATAGFVLL